MNFLSTDECKNETDMLLAQCVTASTTGAWLAIKIAALDKETLTPSFYCFQGLLQPENLKFRTSFLGQPKQI